MARLYPFRALRYDTSRVNMADVVTQPYDKITPEMQDRYYRKSPYNLIRVVLGKREPGDTDRSNVYSRAADDLRSWRREGILREEAEPALYGYSQLYTVPGTDIVQERRGFIALGHLHDYADHVVFRHEQTFPQHKSDRLALFKALRTYPEQIYMLYSDPGFTAEHLIFESPDGHPRPADLEITDEYAVTHRVWKLTDTSLIGKILENMSEKQLIIADGHHRYETSVAYMHERAEELGSEATAASPGTSTSLSSRPEADSVSSRPEADSVSSRPPAEQSSAGGERPLYSPTASAEPGVPDERARWGGEGTSPSPLPNSLPAPPFPEAAMMMTFVNMDADGITILPTHRVVFGLQDFNGCTFAEHARGLFTVEEIPHTPDGHYPGAKNLLQRLHDTERIAFIAATREGDFLLTPKPEAARLLTDLSPRQAELDVVQLHKLVLEHLLGLNEDAVRAGNNVRYVREAHDALQQVGCGNADLALLIKPVTLEQMKNISLNLEVMPQKSTDFYPKLLSGLAMYALD